MSNALPSLSNVPAAPASRPRPTFRFATPAPTPAPAPANRPLSSFPRPSALGAFGQPQLPLAPQPRVAQLPPLPPLPPPVPRTMPERMAVARDRIRASAEAGQRIRSYEVALDLDLSEFHFARQFRAAFGRSPHVYYDEVRAERARALLLQGLIESDVARRVGFRRPAELRSLLSKRADPASA